MSLRRKKLNVIAIVALPFVLAGLYAAVVHIAALHQLNAYKKFLIAHGEKLEMADIMPPPIPENENGADIVNKALALLPPFDDDWTNLPHAMTMIAPGKAADCLQEPDVRDYVFHYTNSWSNVMTVAKANQPMVALLRQAAHYPELDFHVDYTPDFRKEYSRGFDEPSPIEHAAGRILAEALCDLRQGDVTSAATNICAILALANGKRDERLWSRQDERISMVLAGAAANWELLQSTNLNDAELDLLQRAWERQEFIRAMQDTIVMQRAQVEWTFKKLRASGKYYDHIMPEDDGLDFSTDWRDDIGAVWGRTMKFAWYVSWSYSDELGSLKNYQIILETLRTSETNGFFDPAYTNMISRLVASLPDRPPQVLSPWDYRYYFTQIAMGAGIETVKRTIQVEAARRIVITAIALKRYQVKHGNYPPDLNSLVPEFLSAVPLDPIDGQPLRYRLKADRTFLLYSIALDGKDNGGDPSATVTSHYNYWLNPRALDWVWPQLATPEEVQNFYAHPPHY